MKISIRFFSLLILLIFSFNIFPTTRTTQATKELLRRHFPRPLYTLKRKAKEIILKRKRSFRNFLRNLTKKPLSLDKEDFAKLTDEEFLYAYRHALSLRDSEGRIVLSNWIAHKLIDECTKRFDLEGQGYTYDNFDQKGIKEIVKFYQTINPGFDQIQTKFIFSKEENLPESILQDKGKVLYILDLDMNDDAIHHVTMMFADHDSKHVLAFDSLGMLQPEAESYEAFFGSDYRIYYSSARLQHDTRNCMIFAVLVAHRILGYGSEFFSRLETTSDSLNPIPETVLLQQTLRGVEKYDSWFQFVKSQPTEAELTTVQENFLRTFTEVNTLPYEQEIMKSFSKDWLPLLHNNRDYLDYVSKNKMKLQGSIGGLREEKPGQTRNFYLDRLRMKLLYYMAQTS